MLRTIDFIDGWKRKVKFYIYKWLFEKEDLLNELMQILKELDKHIYRPEYRDQVEINIDFLTSAYELSYNDLGMNKKKLLRLLDQYPRYKDIIEKYVNKHEILRCAFNDLLNGNVTNIYDYLIL
jgi:hypothetical protein